MTESALKSFIISLLRKSNFSWKPKQATLKSLRTDEKLVNPNTGKPNITCVCESCKKKVFEKEMKVDHIEPIVPVDGWGNKTRFLGINWNEYLERMFVERDGLQGICKECHDDKTKQERLKRKENEKRSKN